MPGPRPHAQEASGIVNIMYLMRHMLPGASAPAATWDGSSPQANNGYDSGGIFSRYGPKNGISQRSPNSAFTKPITDRNSAVR